MFLHLKIPSKGSLEKEKKNSMKLCWVGDKSESLAHRPAPQAPASLQEMFWGKLLALVELTGFYSN